MFSYVPVGFLTFHKPMYLCNIELMCEVQYIPSCVNAHVNVFTVYSPCSRNPVLLLNHAR